MKRIIVLTVMGCMLLSGCGVRAVLPGGSADAGVSAYAFGDHSTYFDHYSSKKSDSSCKVTGTIHQAADDQNGVITCVTGESEGGSMKVTGSMDCIEGSIRLIYMAADGTEITIAEGKDRKIETEFEVPEGEGTIGFAGNGTGAVCRFRLKLEAGEHVNFGDVIEEVEGPAETEYTDDFEAVEGPEEIEDFESAEELEGIENCETAEDPEEFGIGELRMNEIEDDWPESIRYHADGLYAQPLSTSFEVEKPITLSLTCKTRDGKLRLKIISKSRGEERVYYDEINPDGEYTVEIDKAGICQALFYAEYHVGSVEIVPLERIGDVLAKGE